MVLYMIRIRKYVKELGVSKHHLVANLAKQVVFQLELLEVGAALLEPLLVLQVGDLLQRLQLESGDPVGIDLRRLVLPLASEAFNCVLVKIEDIVLF